MANYNTKQKRLMEMATGFFQLNLFTPEEGGKIFRKGNFQKIDNKLFYLLIVFVFVFSISLGCFSIISPNKWE